MIKKKRLYIFVKAEIIRPAEALQDLKQWDLNRISLENHQAFEATEKNSRITNSGPASNQNQQSPCMSWMSGDRN